MRRGWVRPYDKRRIISARTGRLGLAHRRVEWGSEAVGSFQHYMRGVLCPCGKGLQTLRHVHRECTLVRVSDARELLVERLEAFNEKKRE